MTENRAILAGVCIVGAALIYLASCGPAGAADHELRFRNADATRSTTAIETPWGTVPVACAPGATCSVTVTGIEFGRYPRITIRALIGADRSEPSNALERVIWPSAEECLALDACRSDYDATGTVTVSDFSRFLSSFAPAGSWLPQR